MEGKNFTLIGVNSDKLERALKAVKDNELNWRSFRNEQEEGKISSAWGVKGWPTLIVLDQNMEVVYRGHDGHKATSVAKDLVAKSKTMQ